jgi:hypothetical protein
MARQNGIQQVDILKENMSCLLVKNTTSCDYWGACALDRSPDLLLMNQRFERRRWLGMGLPTSGFALFNVAFPLKICFTALSLRFADVPISVSGRGRRVSLLPASACS